MEDTTTGWIPTSSARWPKEWPRWLIRSGPKSGRPSGSSGMPGSRMRGGRWWCGTMGCVFPGGDAPPSACEAHHRQPWWADGATYLSNGVLLCPYHHRIVEPDPNRSAAVQWQILIDPATGLPWFIPPRHIDPDRVPRLHHRFLLKGTSPPTAATAQVEKCATPADLVPSPAWHSWAATRV